MGLSTKGRYGLRVMLDLALHFGTGPVPVEAIAHRQGISGKYIHVLMTGLRAASLVRTTRGPGGGYELARSPSSITAREVVFALDGALFPVACVTGDGACERSSGCVVRDLWREVAVAVDRILDDRTLEDLAVAQRMRTPVSYDI